MLVSLKLRKNALMSVPAALFTLKSLSLLDLTGNAIRELPEELGAALAIKVLLLSGPGSAAVQCSFFFFFFDTMGGRAGERAGERAQPLFFPGVLN